MKWQIITVGKPAFPWAKLAVQEYHGRLQRGVSAELVPIRDGTSAQVTAKVLTASEGALRLVLDERGRKITSVEFAAWIEKHHLAGTKRVCVLIGGADGHSPDVRAVADETWCLSALTLQHDMALVLFLEQLYRAHSILQGGPYHRD